LGTTRAARRHRIGAEIGRNFRPNPDSIVIGIAVIGVSTVANRLDAQIDEIVAACDGNLMGALQALLLVNERLELEIAQLRAAAPRPLPGSVERPLRSLTPSSKTPCAAPGP
jgi:hypothetical protein